MENSENISVQSTFEPPIDQTPQEMLTPSASPESQPSPSDEAMTDQEESASAEELSSLRAEVARLQEELAKKDREQEKALREIGEFNRLFPDIAIKQVPDSVWEMVKDGIPLSAAYALYEKRSTLSHMHAEEINRRNASLSAGKAGKDTAGEYFSPEEVRAMSQKQVHQNYQKIMESMKSWG